MTTAPRVVVEILLQLGLFQQAGPAEAVLLREGCGETQGHSMVHDKVMARAARADSRECSLTGPNHLFLLPNSLAI